MKMIAEVQMLMARLDKAECLTNQKSCDYFKA